MTRTFGDTTVPIPLPGEGVRSVWFPDRAGRVSAVALHVEAVQAETQFIRGGCSYRVTLSRLTEGQVVKLLAFMEEVAGCDDQR